VLGVGGDDAVLASHVAFLGDRYGSGAAQLGGGLEVRVPLRGRRAYAAARSAAAGGGSGEPRRELRPADAAGRTGGGGGWVGRHCGRGGSGVA